MDILENIRNMAKRDGRKIAIQGSKEALTYQELEEYSNRLAVFIHRNCRGDKKPVVVYGHKSPYMIVCFLACVKAGCAYCPQDISIPKSRVYEVIESVEPDLIFAVEGELDAPCGHQIDREEILNVTAHSDMVYDRGWQVTGTDDYYIIFTSGSTGRPKGVRITTDCLNHFLEWSVGLLGTGKEQRGAHFLNQAPFSFDLSVMDLYTCLASGGTLFAMEKAMQGDYGKMYEFLADSDIQVWVSTPSFADVCLSDKSFAQKMLPNLKLFLFCGEVLTTSTAQHLLERFDGAKIINTYGPTESTVAVTGVEITKALLEEFVREGKPLPVGYAKPHTFIEIRDENGQKLSDGEQGEIVIIGNTVSAGYYRQQELTEKSFGSCIREEKDYPFYHTGDAGYLKNGCLYYNGRIDLQVKLHGYRIEIEDIENNMVRLSQIDHAVVVPTVKEGKVRSLTAFVTGETGGKSQLEFAREVKTELKRILPSYMIPKKIKYLDTIPMTNHGKADRKYLGGLVS